MTQEKVPTHFYLGTHDLILFYGASSHFHPLAHSSTCEGVSALTHTDTPSQVEELSDPDDAQQFVDTAPSFRAFSISWRRRSCGWSTLGWRDRRTPDIHRKYSNTFMRGLLLCNSVWSGKNKYILFGFLQIDTNSGTWQRMKPVEAEIWVCFVKKFVELINWCF